MHPLTKIRQAGFTLAVSEGKLLVTPAKKLTDQQREFIKQHKAQIIAELKAAKNDDGLSPQDKAAILRWLTFIGENNQEIIDDVLDYCSKNPEGLAYYLARSKEVDRATRTIKPGEVLA
jgi:hypothetical protein